MSRSPSENPSIVENLGSLFKPQFIQLLDALQVPGDLAGQQNLQAMYGFNADASADQVQPILPLPKQGVLRPSASTEFSLVIRPRLLRTRDTKNGLFTLCFLVRVS